jgi:serine protease
MIEFIVKVKHRMNKIAVSFKVLRTIGLALVIAVGLIAIVGSIGEENGSGGGSRSSPTYTLSGTIQASDTNVIDTDVNDPLAPYEPNDTFEQAQEVPNPAIIGGYVNVVGAGEIGRSWIDGDEHDYFKAALAASQTINLYIGADPEVADLNLYLYDESQTLIDASMGNTDVETLTVAVSGTYFIFVEADDGASNYNLTIGYSSGTSAGKGILRLSGNFVPGEAIVSFKDDVTQGNSEKSSSLLASSVGMVAKAGAPGRPMLLGFSDETTRRNAFQALGISEADLDIVSQDTDPKVKNKLDTLHIINALCSHPGVAYAEPNYYRRTFETPDDTYYSLQWHYPLINLPQAWDTSLGDDVIVAVIDTGVLLNHPDLQGRLITGYDFISDLTNAVDGDGIDSNPDDPGDGGVGGSSFHGTHVAGTIAAATNNSDGVAGIAWNAKIMPLRVLGKLGGTTYDIQQAVRYAAGLVNDSGTTPAQPAHIINLSLGGGGFSQSSQDVYTAARNAGLIIIAAAGNESTSTPSYPASYEGVVSVSAVDIRKNPAWYSNFGTAIDVAAPGGDTRVDTNHDGYADGVLSTCGDDSGGSIQFVYSFYQGTSMASPHMAGVVALMKAIYWDLSPDNLDVVLESEAITQDLGNAGWDERYGWGLINALKAVSEAQWLFNGGELPAILVVDPASLDFGATSTTASLTLTNGGGSGTTLAVDSPIPSEDWLTVTPEADVDANGLGTYTATVDRSGIANDGVYSATITVTYTVDSKAREMEVPVSMRVGAVTGSGNAGFHYVLLVNPDTLETLEQVNVGYSESIGGYEYAFTGVSADTYQIFAGTDSNNDGFLGDAGEAFGAYITVDQPTSVAISSDTSDLDFATGFDVNLPSQLGAREPANRTLLRLLSAKHVSR